MLKAFDLLVERNKLPIACWVKVLEAVHERLCDSSVTVQRAALRLMQTMVE